MRILLVEDDSLIASGLSTALGKAGHVVDHLARGDLARTALSSGHGFDLVILDLGLPGLDGTEVLKTLRQDGQDTPVLILSARDATQDRVKGLDLGADHYLTKPFDLEELLAHVRVLERRVGRSVTNLICIGALELDPQSMQVRWQGKGVELQRREFMLLKRMAERPNQVLTRAQLQESLYGWGEGVDSNAIDVHVHSLRRKFHPAIVKTVRGVGYRLGEPEQWL